MNIEEFHQALENRHYGVLPKIATKHFMERTLEQGGFIRYNNVFPLGETPTRVIVDTIQTQPAKTTVVDNTYVVDKELLVVTDLVWEIKENNKWKIDKFFILEISSEPLTYIS